MPDVKASPSKALDVLVVDDDREMAMEFVDSLSRTGLACASAGNGWEALQLLADGTRVSVVVSDLRMPELDGLMFAEHLQRMVENDRPEIVFVSGDPEYEDAVKAIRLGARDMLNKPVEPDALVRAVKSALVVRKMRKGASAAEPQSQPSPKPPAERRRATLDSLRSVRKVRAKYFPSELFSDPCWEMLLDLYDSQLAGQSATVTSLSAASGVPTTTAWRRILTLEEYGLIQREEDANDKRRINVRLSRSGLLAVENFFETYSSRQDG